MKAGVGELGNVQSEKVYRILYFFYLFSSVVMVLKPPITLKKISVFSISEGKRRF